MFALSYKRAYGKCVERDTNAFAGTYRHSACNSLSAACAHMQAPTSSLECRHMDACIHACIYECVCSSHQAHAITYIDGCCNNMQTVIHMCMHTSVKWRSGKTAAHPPSTLQCFTDIHARALYRQSYRALLLVHRADDCTCAVLHNIFNLLLSATASASKGGGHRYATVLDWRGAFHFSTLKICVCCIRSLIQACVRQVR